MRDKEKQRARDKRYRKSKKGREKKREIQRRYDQSERGKATAKRHYRANKERIRAGARRQQREETEEALALLGNCCERCEGRKRLEFHKRDGQPHRRDPALVLRNPELFMLLCKGCHVKGHKLIRDILADMI